MFSTYDPKDVTLLLKDITGLVDPLPTNIRERLIQSGTHYCEMLPIEYKPSDEYMRIYHFALAKYSKITAQAVAVVSERIYQEKGNDGVLVSLARAGTPIGILIKRYLKSKYGVSYPHYSISIIRGRGIDQNAMNYILSNHKPSSIQFVDGWTGKGAIQRQLIEAMVEYPEVSSGLAVLSDPARVASLAGTNDDFLIPSSCLNSIVSGLLSRTFLRNDIIGPKDFHGAVFYKELVNEDLTEQFLSSIEKNFPRSTVITPVSKESDSAMCEVMRIKEHFNIRDINLVKPSIGEATRVLLRRLPWKILVWSMKDEDHLGHIYQLAKEKNVVLECFPLKFYRACGLIREVPDA